MSAAENLICVVQVVVIYHIILDLRSGLTQNLDIGAHCALILQSAEADIVCVGAVSTADS